jgi:hypothetical protein
MMNLETFKKETANHRQVYESLRPRIAQEFAGKYLVLTGGRFLAADTYDQAKLAVEQLGPVPEYCLIFPAEMEPPFELAYDFGDQ